jgi:hypothetical protein
MLMNNKRIIRALQIVCAVLLSMASPVAASEVVGTLATGGSTPAPGTVVYAPTADPSAGTYTSAQSVTLTASGASSIHYTTDGSVPDCESGLVYADPIAVSSSVTIKALSCYAGGASSVTSFAYTISTSEPTPSGGGGGGNGPIVGTFGVSSGGGTSGGSGGTTGSTGGTGGTTLGTDNSGAGVPGTDTTGGGTSGGNTTGGGTGGSGTGAQDAGGQNTESTATGTPETSAASSTSPGTEEGTSTAAQAAAAGLAGNLGDNWYWWLLFILALIAAGLYWRNRRNQGGQ